ncbi:hypothetical protein FNH05_02555 [Amycolatopsis rhizosphaerae]|uniref:Uncharacterized protein n=1 Tax=Amycolatopsis rhizosphaerae TaxID=2053003 RepID=A0A558DKX0_9PSEU|nr:hypothetical protein [Amycolatopsis rhizosphaerae]TVT61660.1 hypothetical protein FNH05_02555 [Amycolatopsis rhizosphaerae]
MGWPAVLVLGAGLALGIVSRSTVATAGGFVLGLLLAAIAASAAIIMSGRVWLLFPAFMTTCLYIASGAVTSAATWPRTAPGSPQQRCPPNATGSRAATPARLTCADRTAPCWTTASP